MAIGSEKLGIDFSIGSCTDLFLDYLSAEDIYRFRRDGSWEQEYYYAKSNATRELDVLPVLLGTFRRVRSHIVGAKMVYGRPLPISCKVERNKGFYQADFALEELLDGSIAFPVQADCLIRALESNGPQPCPSQTKTEAQQGLALLVFAKLFLLLAVTVQRYRYLAFSQ